MNITDWAEEDRPRERLAAQGASALSVPELLAILVGSGNKNENAVALMQRVFADHDCSLKRLGRASVEQLCEYNGVGSAKAVTIIAACELAQRRLAEEGVTANMQVTCSSDIYKYFLPKMQDLAVEECHVLLLNQAHRILGSRMVSRGGLASTAVDVRVVLRNAILAQAPAIVLVHNHPSGSVKPSVEDDRLTKRVKEAASTMDIRLVDHIVVADGGYYSFCDEGRL